MNRIFTVTLLFLLTVISSTYAQTGGAWVKKADVSTFNRESAVGFSINSKGYIGLGLVSASPNGALWEYSNSTGTWTQKANMPLTTTGRVNAVAFSIGSYGYVATGADAMFNLTKTLYSYDPNNNVWTARAPFAGTAREEAVGFSIGSKGYIGTGDDGTRRKDFWEYDPTANTWTQKADFGGTARDLAVGFSIGTKGYIGTGNDGTKKKDFWEYDQATNVWTRKADFGGAAREGAVAFVVNNKGYITTGDAGSGKNDIWEYNPTTNGWVQRANFTGQARYVAAGFAVGGRGYIGTGFTDEPSVGVNTKDFYEFTPPIAPAVPTNVMVTAYNETSIRIHWLDQSYDETGFTVERSTDGTTFTTVAALPAGAITYTDKGLTTGQEYYYRVISTKTSEGVASVASNVASQIAGTPHNGAWTMLADNNASSGKPSFDNGVTTFTLNGIIYLTGGDVSGTPVESYRQLWAYDPAAGTFTQKAIFGGAARTNGVGFALNGKGYVGTGSTATGATNSVNDFWQYDPASNAWTRKADLGTVGRFNAFFFTANNKGYVGGGTVSSTGVAAQDFYEYDPAADTWTQKANFSQTVSNAHGVGYHNKGYVIQGYGSSIPISEYDPTANTWTAKATFPIIYYNFRELIVIKDRLFASTYTSDSPYRSSLWEYEVTAGRWIERAPHSSASQYSSANVGNTDDLIYYFIQHALYEYNPDFDLVAPSAIGAEIVDPAKVILTWSLDAAATKAQIYRAESVAGPYTLVAEVSSDKSSYVDQVDVENKTLYYQVRANNGTLLSEYSKPVLAAARGAWKALKKMGNDFQMWGDIAAATSTHGYLGVSFSSKTWWEFNPENETWTQKASFPGEYRSFSSSFVIDDVIYAGFGYIYDQTASKYKGFSDFYSYSPASNAWTKLKDFPGTRRLYASATSGNGKGYLLGGDDDTGAATSFLKDAWEYNPSDDSWTSLPDMPVGAAFVAPFVRNNKLAFVNGAVKHSATGWGGVNQHYQLDLATGIWTKELPTQNNPSGPVHQINDQAYFNVTVMTTYNFTSQKWVLKPGFPGYAGGVRSFVLNGKIYAINSSLEVWVYNPDAAVLEPSNFDSEFLGDRILLKWQNATTLPVRTEIQYMDQSNQYSYSYSTLATTEVGATQYTFTDVKPDNNYAFRAVSILENGEQSVPTKGTFENSGPYWTELQKVPMTTRSSAVSFFSNGKMYYGTGTTGSVAMKDMWEYDLTTGAWTQKADFPGVERAGATTFTLGAYVYVGFGKNAGAGSLNDMYRYSSSTNTWSATVNYPNNNGIYGPGVFVSNGYAYLIGGATSSAGTTSELWRFDGLAWTQRTSLPGETRRDAMVFALNGKAYVGGGSKEASGTTSSAGKAYWEYTIATDTWKQLNDLPDNVATQNRSYIYPGSNSALAFITPNGGSAGSGLQARVYSISTDTWSSIGKPLTNNYLSSAFSTAQDPITGYVYAMVTHSEFGLKLWRFDYQPEGPNLVEASVTTPGTTARLKWRRMNPQPDSVVIYRSNESNVLGMRQGVVKTADTTTVNGISPGQTYYYSIRSYSNSGQFKTSSQRMLIVDQAPATPIELVGELVGDHIVLNWLPGSGAPAASYVIQRATGSKPNFVDISTTTAITHSSSEIIAATMSYRVKAINGGGESDYSNVVTISITGIEEEQSIGVYPNPTSDFITIEVESQDGPVNMQLLDYHGRKLSAQVLTSTTRVDMTPYSAGIYFVNLVSTKRASSKYIKIIKK